MRKRSRHGGRRANRGTAANPFSITPVVRKRWTENGAQSVVFRRAMKRVLGCVGRV